VIEDNKPERRDAYRLERIEDDGSSVAIAVFHTLREAQTIIPSLDDRYRLMLGDRLVWPNEVFTKASRK
jgi:hypothetical protein